MLNTTGYNSAAVMEEPALRDLERWKDKIEVRLDNRQVFFLFFGSALVACMLFVLGVIVGKRLESRGRAEAQQPDDPLALLDKVATAPARDTDDGLTFPKALLGNGSGKTDGRKDGAGKAAASSIARTKATASPSPASVAVSTPPPAPPEERKAAAVAPAAPPPAGKKTGTAAEKAPAAAEKKAAVAAKGAPEKTALAPDARAPAASPAPKASPAKTPQTARSTATTVASTSQPKPTSAAAGVATAPADVAAARPQASLRPTALPLQNPIENARNKGRFTLQLSAFPTRAEAEAFARKFSGENAYILPTELPGKGTWYRVRAGDFASAKEAIEGKAAFERRHGVIAYVAGR